MFKMTQFQQKLKAIMDKPDSEFEFGVRSTPVEDESIPTHSGLEALKESHQALLKFRAQEEEEQLCYENT